MSPSEDRVARVFSTAESRDELVDELRKLAHEGLSTLELRRAVSELEARDEERSPLRVVVLSSYTTELLRDALSFEALLRGFQLDLQLGEFGQVEQELLSGRLFREPVDATLLLLTAEDALREGRTADELPALTELVRLARTQATGELVLSVLPDGWQAGVPKPVESPDVLNAAVDWGSHLDDATCFDTRMWEASQFPLRPKGALRLVARLFAMALRQRSTPIKCVVLDCDNTLWGGVVGEEGVEGVDLSETWLEFQRRLLAIRERGVLLALSSRNDEAIVRRVFEERAESVLEFGHFSAWRIHWEDKAQSLQELAEELNLGLDSFLFVDDSEFECQRVRLALPSVRVSSMPSEPHEIANALAHLQELELEARTEEDRLRPERMREARARESSRAQVTSLEEYLDSLEMVLHIREDPADEAERIAQLCQRTNQFNLTTHRHTRDAIESFLASDDARVATCSLSDRFGELGVIGVMIVTGCADNRFDVDTCLFSCRALGRRAEEVFVHDTLASLTNASPGSVTAQFIPTAKNARASEFWRDLGFSEKADGRFEIQADQLTTDHPAAVHFRIRRDEK